MSAKYTNKPKVSSTPYLYGEGHAYANTVSGQLSAAIDEINLAITALSEVEGIGAELYITKLRKIVQKFEKIRIAVQLID